jgi:hypothetical protein
VLQVEPGQISLTLVLDQSSTIPQKITIEDDNCTKREKCNERPIQKKLLEKETTIQDHASLAICSPRQYRCPIAVACKKLVSQMANILRNLKLQSSNLICNQSALFCSSIDDILESYRNPRRPNHSSFIYKNVEQDSNTTISSSNVDYKKYICSKCSIESKCPSKDVDYNTSHLLKSPSNQSNVDAQVMGTSNAQVMGTHYLFHPNSEQDNICNIENSRNQKQFYEEIQEKPKCFNQFDSVYGAVDHHFVDLEYVRSTTIKK